MRRVRFGRAACKRSISSPRPEGEGNCKTATKSKTGSFHGTKKASDFPQELLNLFDHYVHGDIDRRGFLDGAQKFAVGGLTATALFEMLRPNYAWAHAGSQGRQAHQDRDYETVPSPQGNGTSRATWCARRTRPEKLPGVLVVHENRGLNPYIEDVARRLAVADFMAFAPDGLTSVGGYPGDDEKGGSSFSRRSTAPR